VNTPAGSGLFGGGNAGAVTLSLLTSCADGQLLKWTVAASSWGCANDLTGAGGGGTVKSITAGTGLTANGVAGASINTSGTLAIDTAVVPQLGTTPLTVTLPAGTFIASASCITQPVAAPGTTTSMVTVITPAGNPITNGLAEVTWQAFVNSPGSVTAEFCHFGRTIAQAISNQVFKIRVIK
jgi:hypothetical protein